MQLMQRFRCRTWAALAVILLGVAARAEAHSSGGHDHAGHSHSGASHEADVEAATIKLHRMANDPLGAEDVDGAKALLAGGHVNINYQHPRTGQTALMSASLGGKAKLVKLLLDSGADHTVPEKDGYTPCHGAGFQGRAEVMRVLVAHGLDCATNFHKGDGFTPFHRACWGKEKRHADTVALMIDEMGVSPASMSKPDAEGRGGGASCSAMTTNLATRAVLEPRLAKLQGEL